MKTKLICDFGSNWKTLDDILYTCEAVVGMGAIPKGQLWRTDKFINKKRHPKMYSSCKKYEIDHSWVKTIKREFPSCFWSVFDKDSLRFLESEICPDYYKVSLFDSDQRWLIEALGKTNTHTFISCGVYGLDSIRNVVKWFNNINKLTLMHCVGAYDRHDYNLNYLRDRINGSRLIAWGASINQAVKILPVASVSLGVESVEVHYTNNSQISSPDTPHSFTRMELAEIIEMIETVESNMGNSERPLSCELPNMKLAKRKMDGKR